MYLQGGASISCTDIYGQNALILAARFGHDKCVRTLIEVGLLVYIFFKCNYNKKLNSLSYYDS